MVEPASDMQFPGIKWAQRKEKVFLTIELQATENPQIDLTEEGVLTFSGVSNSTKYGFTMEFFATITKSECKHNTNGRYPVITLSKTDKDTEYWPRLTKEKLKNSRITVDWNKWVDEDEEADAPAEMNGDFDPSMMITFGGGGGGMPGVPGGMGEMPNMSGVVEARDPVFPPW